MVKGCDYVLITKEVEVKWNSRNKKHYISKGYVFTAFKDTFTAKIEDVMKGSETLVDVKCDYCDELYTKTYYKYNHHRKTNLVKDDCCKRCSPLKIREVTNIKYGVDNVMQVNEVKEKVTATMVERYGVERHAQTEEGILQFTGKNNPKWKGGITSEYMKLRNSAKQKEWKLSVFTRDDFQCVVCGCNKSGSFNAHHILNFAEHKHLINEVDNGVTLCRECHQGFHSKYGNKNNNQNQLNEFIKHNQDVETIETTA